MKFLTKIIEHKIFQFSLAIKGVHGIIEILLGTILFFLKHSVITRIVQFMYGKELVEDPNDYFGNLLMDTALKFSEHWQKFFSTYLIIHGLASIGIVLALSHKKLWVFPYVAALLSFFIVYQAYQFFQGYSIFMLIFIMIDITILFLLQFEYKRLKKMKQ
jgi:uncharacterized membrane protein